MDFILYNILPRFITELTDTIMVSILLIIKFTMTEHLHNNTLAGAVPEKNKGSFLWAWLPHPLSTSQVVIM